MKNQTFTHYSYHRSKSLHFCEQYNTSLISHFTYYQGKL